MDFSAITEMYKNLLTQLGNIPVWITVIMIAAAALNCFMGYRLMKFWIAVIGFAAGGMLGYFICAEFVNNLGYAILAGFLAGLVLAFIAYKIYLLGVWILAFIMTVQLAGRIQVDKEYWQVIILIAGVFLAVVIGFLAIKFVRPVIIISSGLSGAVTAVTEILKLTGNDSRIVMLTGIGIVAALGILVQFKTTKKRRRR